uniref:Uncharacterized protein n=1 Tax=Ciona savignyi TaxID=51511 RepID=H2YEJ3_CIOSA
MYSAFPCCTLRKNPIKYLTYVHPSFTPANPAKTSWLQHFVDPSCDLNSYPSDMESHRFLIFLSIFCFLSIFPF